MNYTTLDSIRDFLRIISMSGNYEARKLENTERDNFTLDTALVTDREWVYETAVCHKDFRCENWIILEGSQTVEEARKVHKKWLDSLDKDDYDTLTDCYEKTEYKRGKRGYNDK